jgi:hypothetical protein
MVKDIKEALWETSCALASLQGQIDSMGIEVGECAILDKVYSRLSELEKELDSYIEREATK